MHNYINELKKQNLTENIRNYIKQLCKIENSEDQNKKKKKKGAILTQKSRIEHKHLKKDIKVINKIQRNIFTVSLIIHKQPIGGAGSR